MPSVAGVASATVSCLAASVVAAEVACVSVVVSVAGSVVPKLKSVGMTGVVGSAEAVVLSTGLAATGVLSSTFGTPTDMAYAIVWNVNVSQEKFFELMC